MITMVVSNNYYFFDKIHVHGLFHCCENCSHMQEGATLFWVVKTLLVLTAKATVFTLAIMASTVMAMVETLLKQEVTMLMASAIWWTMVATPFMTIIIKMTSSLFSGYYILPYNQLFMQPKNCAFWPKKAILNVCGFYLFAALHAVWLYPT